MEKIRRHMVLFAGLVALLTSIQASAVAAQGLSATPSGYVLGPGDQVKIAVYGEDELSGQYVISPAGVVSIPLAGDIPATGLTVAALETNVRNALQPKYLKDAKVSVELVGLRPFFILGEVDKPGQYPYTAGLTVLDAVATAGGFTYRANTHNVFIKHANQSAEDKVPLTASTIVSAGDTIRIDERHF
jgi:polysaccharide export outer membrane protein